MLPRNKDDACFVCGESLVKNIKQSALCVACWEEFHKSKETLANFIARKQNMREDTIKWNNGKDKAEFIP